MSFLSLKELQFTNDTENHDGAVTQVGSKLISWVCLHTLYACFYFNRTT